MLRLTLLCFPCCVLLLGAPAFSESSGPYPGKAFEVSKGIKGLWFWQRPKDGPSGTLTLEGDQRFPIAKWAIRYNGWWRGGPEKHPLMTIELRAAAGTLTVEKWRSGRTAVKCSLPGEVKPEELKELVQLCEGLLQFFQENSITPFPADVAGKIAARMKTPLVDYMVP